MPIVGLEPTLFVSCSSLRNKLR